MSFLDLYTGQSPQDESLYNTPLEELMLNISVIRHIYIQWV